MYSLTTNSIKVSVTPSYMDEQSIPAEEIYSWAYDIKIENQGNDVVQLISRHWIITDSSGLTKEVRGPGVVGEQPILNPGDVHEYSSGVVLNTQSGLMTGTYQMLKVDEENENMFDIDIPAFSLDTPEQLTHPN